MCADMNIYQPCETCKNTIPLSHSHRWIHKYTYDGGDDTASILTRMNMGSRILAALENYKARPCMGVRDMSSSNINDYANSYTWYTFETVGKRIKRFSRGLQRLLKPYDHVGICASNRPEWVITDFACILQRFISVPIYPQLNERDMIFMINNKNISLVVCDKKTFARFIGIRYAVCMDSITKTIPNTGNDDSSIHYMENIENDESANAHD